MLSARLQADPLRALIWMEATAFALAFAGDLVVARTISVPGEHPTPASVGVYALTTAVTAWLVFSIPHAPNRRFAIIAAAALGVCATGMFPSADMSSLVLLAILAARLTFAFGFRGATIAWGAAFAAIVANSFSAIYRHAANFNLAEALMGIYGYSVWLGLLFGMIGITWLYAKKAAASAASAERMRIAHDLHDSLGHGLTTLTVQLQNAERLRVDDSEKSHAYVKRAMATASELLGDVRETVAILHDDLETTPPPFPSLLDRLHGDFSSSHDLQIFWRVQLAREPSGRVVMPLYRVLQEALTNIARHAQAAHVEVSLFGTDCEIELCVQDDGRGFADEPHDGHGLAFMRARMESVGGALTVTSATGSGTTVHARLPLEARA